MRNVLEMLVRYHLSFLSDVLARRTDTLFARLQRNIVISVLSRSTYYLQKLGAFRIASRSTWLTAAGESHMGWEFAGSSCSLPPFSTPISLSLSLFLSAGYRPPLRRYHRSVLVRADVNACWVAVPDAGFI